jgi:hypothetical protein
MYWRVYIDKWNISLEVAWIWKWRVMASFQSGDYILAVGHEKARTLFEMKIANT